MTSCLIKHTAQLYHLICRYKLIEQLIYNNLQYAYQNFVRRKYMHNRQHAEVFAG